MAFAIPTGCGVDYTEAAVKYAGIVGNSPGTIDTTPGQRVAEGVYNAFWELHNCIRDRGYTQAQFIAWQAAAGKGILMDLAVSYWLLDPSARFPESAFERAEVYAKRAKAVCAGANIYDSNGAVMLPDTSSSEGARSQAETTDRNGPSGSLHDFVLDHSPNQFAGAPGIADAAANRTSTNQHRGLGF